MGMGMKKLVIVLVALIVIGTGALLIVRSCSTTQEQQAVDALVIYSGAAADEAEALTKKFNELYPEITVSIIRAGSVELVNRLVSEQPKPGGDILLMIAKENMDVAYNHLKPYKSGNHDRIDISVRDSAAVPRFYGSSMPLQAIMINTDLLPLSDRPNSWKDLIKPKYAGKIILADPTLSGSAYAQLYMLNKIYDMEFVGKLKSNTYVTESSTAGPEAVAHGEYAITITGESNIGKYIGEGYPVTYVYPAEGTGARFDATAIIANGPNPKAAELFLDFITSVDGYEIIRTTRNRRVVSTELPGPEHLPSLSEIKLFSYDDLEAKNLQEKLIKEFVNL